MSRRSKMTNRLGCRGDHRMLRALRAKIDDPSISLEMALRVGGFILPDTESTSTSGRKVRDSHLYDADGVSIKQRKNQLLRRIRKIKEEEESAERGAHRLDFISGEPASQPSTPIEESFGLEQLQAKSIKSDMSAADFDRRSKKRELISTQNRPFLNKTSQQSTNDETFSSSSFTSQPSTPSEESFGLEQLQIKSIKSNTCSTDFDRKSKKRELNSTDNQPFLNKAPRQSTNDETFSSSSFTAQPSTPSEESFGLEQLQTKSIKFNMGAADFDRKGKKREVNSTDRQPFLNKTPQQSTKDETFSSESFTNFPERIKEDEGEQEHHNISSLNHQVNSSNWREYAQQVMDGECCNEDIFLCDLERLDSEGFFQEEAKLPH